MESPSSKEPLLAATGGLPLALAQRIEADLRVLEKSRIKPVFVFPGLQPIKKYVRNQPPEHMDACRDRRDAWTKYESGQEEAATKLFEGRHGLAQWDLWRMVLRIFRNRNVEFIIAPYIAWAQVSIILNFIDARFVIHFRVVCLVIPLVDLSSTSHQVLHPFNLWPDGDDAVSWCRQNYYFARFEC